MGFLYMLSRDQLGSYISVNSVSSTSKLRSFDGQRFSLCFVDVDETP